MKLELFQTTVREYKRFMFQMPINYSKAMSGDFSDAIYVAAQTRLMLLRKYTRNGRGSLYLPNVISEASRQFSGQIDYLFELQERFQQSCDQSLNRFLADGTMRTLDESIDDTMYGLHLHADEERIHRIIQDNELLRLYCVVTFVKEIETLIVELSDFFEANGVSCIEKVQHKSAPVIHLDSQESGLQNVKGSPFWRNLIGYDMTQEGLKDVFATLLDRYTSEEWQLWTTAQAFTELLAQEQFSYSEMRHLVFEPTIDDWGDFSEAIAYYKAIPKPGISTFIRYNEQRDAAYIHVYPQVEEGFVVDSPQIISEVYVVTLVKDPELGEWKVFAFGDRVDSPILV